MINNFNPIVMNKPFDIWIVDDFLNQRELQRIKDNWPRLNDERWHGGYEYIGGEKNILEYGMMAISKIELIPKSIRKIFEFFYSDIFIEKLQKMTDTYNLVDDKMQWSGLRCMLKDSYQLIHSDARTNPKTGFKKEITCLLYLNENYDRKRDEGCLEIWDDGMENIEHEVEPIDNRLLIFRNSDTSHHGVPKVYSERKALLFNYCKKEKIADRTKAFFKARESDDKNIDKIALKRLEV